MTETAQLPGASDGGAAERSAAPPAGSPRKRRDPLAWLSQFGIVITMFACIVFFSTQDDRFLTVANLRTTLATGAPLLIIALGLTVVLVMGDFDLSVSSMMSAAGALVVVLIVNHGWGWGWAVALTFVFAGLFGLINGVLVAYVGTPSFITTLATGVILAGIEYALTERSLRHRHRVHVGLVPLARRRRARPVDGVRLAGVDRRRLGGVAVAAARQDRARPLHVRHRRQPGGGATPGIRVRRLRAAGFVIVAPCAAIGAIVTTGAHGLVDPNTGASLLLPAFAAAFLGAAMSRRSQFNIGGTVVGVLFLQVVVTGLTFMGYQEDVQNIAQGVILVGAILISRLGASRR